MPGPYRPTPPNLPAGSGRIPRPGSALDDEAVARVTDRIELPAGRRQELLGHVLAAQALVGNGVAAFQPDQLDGPRHAVEEGVPRFGPAASDGAQGRRADRRA